MSPTEHDLRAALRDGEGDAPDPEAVLSAGRARASARRNRFAAVTATVVGVLAVGTTGAILLGHQGSGHPTADSAASRQESAASGGGRQAAAAGSAATGSTATASPAPRVGAGSIPSAPGGPVSGTGGTSCPSSYATLRLPGGGGSGQFGSAQELIPPSATSVVVCGYGSTAAGVDVTPGRIVLTGSDAASLISSLNAAPSTKPNRMCPDFRDADDHRLALIGVTAHGGSAPVYVTINTNPCLQQATNGTAVRYDWSPPAQLRARLLALQPR